MTKKFQYWNRLEAEGSSLTKPLLTKSIAFLGQFGAALHAAIPQDSPGTHFVLNINNTNSNPQAARIEIMRTVTAQVDEEQPIEVFKLYGFGPEEMLDGFYMFSLGTGGRLIPSGNLQYSVPDAELLLTPQHEDVLTDPQIQRAFGTSLLQLAGAEVSSKNTSNTFEEQVLKSQMQLLLEADRLLKGTMRLDIYPQRPLVKGSIQLEYPNPRNINKPAIFSAALSGLI